ncbi:SusC/RagA family TonB-linked outer membrane protein [Carboxylicivirga sp. M1479]|uniref:SusC/RagA family TonB-linked outer membrane protein n=1 Tax=Carboxylicivirga sp. M1479 TaxID=2594476 RepID=UPI001177A7FE|nr:SusC/RagA family TonB-linked outer membrane protein [Carboxylicivirga sp. M1479]TRX71937.1 TonB-dependent receptor [Carboxylicivirga sp. M1479]
MKKNRLRSALTSVNRWKVTSLLIVSMLLVGTHTHARQQEKLNVVLKNASLEEVFTNIEKQSSYRFLYKTDLVDLSKKVDIKQRNVDLESVLQEVLENTDIYYTVQKGDLVIITPSAPKMAKDIQQEAVTIKGKIVDASGDPLPGAAVYLKEDNTIGTITDVEGRYELNIPAGAQTIVYAFIGMENQEVAFAGQSNIDITLLSAYEEMDEVIVVGYGIQKKSNLTGSVANLETEDLKGITSPNVGNMLQGKAAGVFVSQSSGRPGDAPTIRIRGKSTLSGSVDPLWVVDGVIQAEAPQLNPEDIESTSILKDASATALYGSRAANGVILVTTRSAKEGTDNINVAVKAGVTKLSLGNFGVMNNTEMTDYIKSFANGYGDLDWFTNEAQARNTDWFDEGTQLGIVQDYGISFSGGNERLRTYISGNVYDETGAVKGYDYTRYTGRMNIDYDIKPWLTLHPKLGFSYRDILNKQQSVGEMFLNMPYDRPRDDNGTIIDPTDPESGWIGRDKSNSIYNLQWDYTETTELRLSPYFGFDIKLAEGLTFVSSNSFDYQHNNQSSYIDPQSTAGRNDVGSVTNYHYKSLNRFTNQLLRYQKGFGEHYFTGLVAYEFNDFEYSTTLAQQKGIVSGTEILNAGSEMKRIEGTKAGYAFKSYLFNANYTYGSRYMAQFSFRRDGSSKFGTDSQFGNFYSFSGGWNIHNEEFFTLDNINVLKLRASYGALGNTPGNYYPSKELYSVTNQYNKVPVISASQLGNEDLTWERTYSTNIAVDARFYNRIDLSLEYYIKDTKDLLYYVTLPATSGFEGYWENIGAVKNKGFEVVLGADIITSASDGFEWRLDANIGVNRNEITELFEGNDIISGNKIRSVGEDIDTWYMRKWMGVNPDDGMPQWETIDDDGNRSLTTDYNKAALQNVGASTPDFFGGINSTMSYKNLTLTMNLDYVSGIDIYHYARELYDNDGAYSTFNAMSLHDGWSRWEKPGDNATHPQPYNGGINLSNKTSSRYMEDGSYLRLRNVMLNYSLGNIKKVDFLKNVSVYVSAENLVTFTDYSGIDPEVGEEGSGDAYDDYAIPKRFMFGVNMSF